MSPDESQEPVGHSQATEAFAPTAASPQPESDQPQVEHVEHGAPVAGEASQPYGSYPAASPAKKNRGVFIGVAIGAVVVGSGIGAYAALGHSSSPASSASTSANAAAVASATSTATSALATATATASASSTSGANAVSLPSSVDGLLLLTSANAQQEVSRVRAGVDKGGAVFTNALFGAYGPKANGGYRLVVVDQSMANLSSDYQSQFESYTPSDLVQVFATGTRMTGTQVESSSDPSAALLCGTITASGVTVRTCVWDDSETFGFAYFYRTYYTTGLSEAAHDTDALRAAAEAG